MERNTDFKVVNLLLCSGFDIYLLSARHFSQIKPFYKRHLVLKELAVVFQVMKHKTKSPHGFGKLPKCCLTSILKLL